MPHSILTIKGVTKCSIRVERCVTRNSMGGTANRVNNRGGELPPGPFIPITHLWAASGRPNASDSNSPLSSSPLVARVKVFSLVATDRNTCLLYPLSYALCIACQCQRKWLPLKHTQFPTHFSEITGTQLEFSQCRLKETFSAVSYSSGRNFICTENLHMLAPHIARQTTQKNPKTCNVLFTVSFTTHQPNKTCVPCKLLLLMVLLHTNQCCYYIPITLNCVSTHPFARTIETSVQRTSGELWSCLQQRRRVGHGS